MNKYIQIFKISLHQEFAYRLNFILWRLRNVMQILIFFFLWDSVFSGGVNTLFGYDKSRILTYAFVLIIVRAVVMQSRTNDIAGQIANGDLTNLLVKPIKFFKFWFTRDVSSKFLNIIFGVLETFILIQILKPNIFIQTNTLFLITFCLSLIIGIFIFFNLMLLTSFVTFWMPELAWGAQFLFIIVIVEFLSGAVFPLDIFPSQIYQILRFTPFPYLIFIPIKIYLGTVSNVFIIESLLIGIAWCIMLYKLTNHIWRKGLYAYEGAGR